MSGLDREGLELAFKYFSSTTLTMRLCGINQGKTTIEQMFKDISFGGGQLTLLCVLIRKKKHDLFRFICKRDTFHPWRGKTGKYKDVEKPLKSKCLNLSHKKVILLELKV